MDNRQQNIIDELDRLLLAQTTGELTEAQRARLEELVRDHPEARKAYLAYMAIDAQMHWRYRQGQAETQPVAEPQVKLSRPVIGRIGWVAGLAAACVLLAVLLLPNQPANDPGSGTGPVAQNGNVENGNQVGAAADAMMAVDLPESRFGEPIEQDGWRILPGKESRWRMADQALCLDEGELYVWHESLDAPDHELMIETPAGRLKATGTRFYVECEPRGLDEHPPTDSEVPVMKAKTVHALRLYVLAGAVLLSNPMGQVQAAAGESAQATSETAPAKLQEQGNYKEAYDIYSKLIVDSAYGGKDAAKDVNAALDCLMRLNRVHEWDDLGEKVIEAHPTDWRVLQAVAKNYQRAPHYGVMIDNKYVRNQWRGQRVNTSERDRLLAMQLMQQAMPHALADDNKSDVADFLDWFAGLFPTGRDAWRLQYLTDLSTLPDYDDPVYHGTAQGAPVTADNKPVYHDMPESWKKAASDGQRWRWLLMQQAEVDPTRKNRAQLAWANFLWQQFGVHTMGYAPKISLDDDAEVEPGPYSVYTLKTTETIARLASGIQRFDLPDEYNFMKIYQQIADDGKKNELKDSPINKLTYKLYKGDWDKLPKFDELKPVKQGNVKNNWFDVSFVDLREQFGMVFEGEIQVPQDGKYTFALDSDDGSRLMIGDDRILAFDGLHGMGAPQRATFTLKKGTYPIRLEYFEKTGNEGISVSWSGPGIDGEQYLSPTTHQTPQVTAMERLAEIHENRLQYPQAAKTWKTAIDRYGPGRNNIRRDRLEQIVEPWGRFDQTKKFAQGQPLALGYVYRNGKKVNLKATTIKVDLLLDDIKAYIKSNPKNWEYQKYSPQYIGQRLVRDNETKYLGKQAAEWSMDLKARPNHWDRRVDVPCPMEEPGAYLVEAMIDGGNTTRVIVWVTNTAIVAKPLDHRMLYFVTDALTGKPIEKVNIEYFGYRREYERQSRQYNVDIKNFSENTDADGIAIPDKDLLSNRYQWLTIARQKESNRFGVFGFNHVWDADYNEANYQAAKAYVFTDRPVYRPDQKVHFKAWVRVARYDMAYVSHFAGRKFWVRINDPRGQKMYEKQLTANEYGAVTDTIELGEEASLGRYQVSISEKPYVDPFTQRQVRERHLGGVQFRVEEYKKPEFEVTVDAPDKPITLGEQFEATVKAKYYFGAPVTNAKVTYTVKRTASHEDWIPPRPWDWFYGPGYGWCGRVYPWYPGWDEWGCWPPGPWWGHNPPEVVAQNTVPIGEDGTAKIQIDSAIAKELFGDSDSKYTITAEVTDESRRTIVGSGSVIAARKPFKVYAWLDGGHYRVGQTINAHFRARTPDGKSVKGKGKVTLYAVSADLKGNVNEKPVQTWDVQTEDDGSIVLKMKATQAGQYRIACNLTDESGHVREGATVAMITGDDKLKGKFRFNDLELVLDKAEYNPGDRVKLLVNTNRSDSTVMLFIRPADGVYRMPEIIRMDGQTAQRSIDIDIKDMPNIYVEALTVSDGQVHTQTQKIVVPPVKRVLDVAVEPSQQKYQPGDRAKVKVKLTDRDGKPFVGETVISVYDKSIEYIASPNAGDIRAFFWKWQRHHNVNGNDNLGQRFNQLIKPNEKQMGNIGVFGNLVAMLDKDRQWGMDPGDGGGIMLGGGVPTPAMRSRNMAFGLASGAEADAVAPMAATIANDAGMEEKSEVMSKSANAVAGRLGDAGDDSAEPAMTVRKEFADSAYWTAAVVTDANGIAEIEIPMPENLTTWKIQTWALGQGTVVGSGSAEVITAKDLIIRLQAPRFFVQKDTVTLSANVHNYLDADKDVKVAIDLAGGCLKLASGEQAARTISVKKNGDRRIDWQVQVVAPGEATVQMSARTDKATDAMEMKYPVYVHGMLKTDSYSAAIRPEDKSATLTVTVPEQRQPEQTLLEVRYSPSVALAMVDALPYLAGYEYKHSEASVSRFVPLVITQKLLKDMNINLEEVKRKRTNLNPQEIGNTKERAAQWKKGKTNPVFDNEQVEALVKRGLNDLASMQNGDGGWGWTPRSDPDAHSTAYVVSGLLTARDTGLAIVPNMIERGINWLVRHQKEEVRKLDNAKTRTKPWKEHADNLDAYVAMVLCRAGKPNKQMLDYLYRDRTKLSVYSLAMCGIAYDLVESNDRRDMVLRNVKQYMVIDKENQTAHLNLPNQNFWWRWYGSEIEAHAYFLKLLARIEPKGEIASGVAKYLMNNRKHATWWHCTRDTALSIEALGEFVRASGEDKADMTVEVLVDGKQRKQIHITPDNMFTFDNVVMMKGDAVSSGKHVIQIKREGKGPLYCNAYLTNFTLEDFITKAGLEIKVERRYYKLERDDKAIKAAGSSGQVVDYRVQKYKRVPLNSGDKLVSGDLVEIELIIESKNDYEHLLFEDFKPAGLEPVDLQSGYRDGAYMELRDEKVAFMLRRMARGTKSITYRMRAEIPGTFSALPTKGVGVYAPELRANSDEIKLMVVDE